VKLSVSLITKDRYWKAGEEIPDDRVPIAVAKHYATDAAHQEPSRPAADTAHTRSRKPVKGSGRVEPHH
jgi:hypothetical protein